MDHLVISSSVFLEGVILPLWSALYVFAIQLAGISPLTPWMSLYYQFVDTLLKKKKIQIIFLIKVPSTVWAAFLKVTSKLGADLTLQPQRSIGGLCHCCRERSSHLDKDGLGVQHPSSVTHSGACSGKPLPSLCSTFCPWMAVSDISLAERLSTTCADLKNAEGSSTWLAVSKIPPNCTKSSETSAPSCSME